MVVSKLIKLIIMQQSRGHEQVLLGIYLQGKGQHHCKDGKSWFKDRIMRFNCLLSGHKLWYGHYTHICYLQVLQQELWEGKFQLRVWIGWKSLQKLLWDEESSLWQACVSGMKMICTNWTQSTDDFEMISLFSLWQMTLQTKRWRRVPNKAMSILSVQNIY